MNFIGIYTYNRREEDLDSEGSGGFQALAIDRMEAGCEIAQFLISMYGIELVHGLTSIAEVPPFVYDFSIRGHRRSGECDFKRRRTESGLGIN